MQNRNNEIVKQFIVMVSFQIVVRKKSARFCHVYSRKFTVGIFYAKSELADSANAYVDFLTRAFKNSKRGYAAGSKLIEAFA